MQFADVQLPPLRTWLELEHAKHPLGPAPTQLEQLPSHFWHVDEVLSKNSPFEHVGRQRPLVSTGRPLGQLAHWLKEVPEHVAQSGWQETHVPEELKADEGQEETHLPAEAS